MENRFYHNNLQLKVLYNKKNYCNKHQELHMETNKYHNLYKIRLKSKPTL